MKQTTAVLVWRGERVCWVGWDGMVRGRCLGAHSQASPKRTTSLHFHPISDGHMILDGLLFIHSCSGGGRRREGPRSGETSFGGVGGKL